jgi:hypothetical protein
VVGGFAPFAFTLQVWEGSATAARYLVELLPFGDHLRIAFVIGLLDASLEARRVAGMLEGGLPEPVTYVDRHAWRESLTGLANATKGDADEFVRLVPFVQHAVDTSLGRDAVALALARSRDATLGSPIDALGQGELFFEAHETDAGLTLEESYPVACGLLGD